ncbi:MAG: HD-GYP domain-containing protein [Candidatus Omnitrophica bacterium]|nr:HD-GYP domain-containing protein [Candidatus Omnitrophota bacterium]
MASNLHKAREKLVDYFYRAIQTLVRVLESRDAYTKGHSDRVAKYAEKIAVEMGLAAQKVELVKEAALLHDIGKLGVQEMILKKKSELSEEDRQTIRKHPLIGEELLKPVSLNKEMIAVVKEHHERYDGKGYPDGLAGDKIDILAAIVSAADSYDAMTSHREYRKNLDKDEAIEQLRKNSGLQFNPRVVEAFVRVLEGK